MTIDWSTVVRLVMFDISVDVLFDFGNGFAVSRARVGLFGIVRTSTLVVVDVVRFHLLLDVFEHSIEMIETKDRRSVQKWLDFFVLRFGSDLVVGSLDFLEDFRMTLFGFHIQVFVRVMLSTQSSIRTIDLLRGRRTGHPQYTVWIRHSFFFTSWNILFKHIFYPKSASTPSYGTFVSTQLHRRLLYIVHLANYIIWMLCAKCSQNGFLRRSWK